MDYELIEKIPGSWEEFKFSDYLKILDLEVSEDDEFDGSFNGIDNTLKVISALTNISISELEAIEIQTITSIAKKLYFMVELPNTKNFKSKISWKKLEEVSYGEYITYVMLAKEPFKNLKIFIKAFSSDDLTEEEIDNLSMMEAYAAFFTLNKYVGKSMNSMARKERMKLIKLLWKEKIVQPIRQRFSQKKTN